MSLLVNEALQFLYKKEDGVRNEPPRRLVDSSFIRRNTEHETVVKNNIALFTLSSEFNLHNGLI